MYKQEVEGTAVVARAFLMKQKNTGIIKLKKFNKILKNGWSGPLEKTGEGGGSINDGSWQWLLEGTEG